MAKAKNPENLPEGRDRTGFFFLALLSLVSCDFEGRLGWSWTAGDGIWDREDDQGCLGITRESEAELEVPKMKSRT